jgi:DNA-binding transcriptional LysR family regulator
MGPLPTGMVAATVLVTGSITDIELPDCGAAAAVSRGPAAGRALRPFAETALAAVRDAEAAVRAVRSEDRGTVAVALVGTLASTGLTAVLRRFARLHPRVELVLRTATSREVSDLVRRAEVSFGLRYAPDTAPDLHRELLFEERMVVAAAPDHRLASARGMAVGELGGERWIAFPRPPDRPEVSASHLRRALELAGVDESRILRIDSLTAQKRLVEAGFGIVLVPESAVVEERAAGSLVVLDVVDLDVAVRYCW